MLGALRRFRWSSLAVVVLVTAAAGAAGVALTPSGSATASMALTTPSNSNVLAPGSGSDAVLTRYASQRAAFATSDTVLADVVEAVPGTSLTGLRDEVTVTATAGSNTLTITVDSGRTATSVAVGNAVITAYRLQTQAQLGQLTDAALAAIDSTSKGLTDRLASSPTGAAASSAATTLSSLEQQANALNTDRAVFGDGVEFSSAATGSANPGLPTRDLALGLVVGLALAAVIAWLRADADPRIADGAVAADAVGAPLLGVVTEVTATGPTRLRDLPSAAYRPVVPALALRASAGVVLVTSATRSEGRTLAALNLAVASAREGLRVLLVDADLEQRSISHLVGSVGVEPGVLDLLGGAATASLSGCALTQTVGPDHDLHVLVVGRGGGDVDVELSRLRDMVEAARDSYDLVVIDAAPLPGGGLAALLARLSDSVLVVVRRGSAVSGVSATRRLLALYGTPVAGVVLTVAAPVRRRRRSRTGRRAGVVLSAEVRPS